MPLYIQVHANIPITVMLMGIVPIVLAIQDRMYAVCMDIGIAQACIVMLSYLLGGNQL